MSLNVAKQEYFGAVSVDTHCVLWDSVLESLRNELPEFAFESWFLPLAAEENSGTLTLHCPSSFHRDRIRNNYLELIHRFVGSHREEVTPVVLNVRELKKETVSKPTAKKVLPADSPSSANPIAKFNSGRPEQSSLNHSFDSFVTGPCNALAREASLAIIEGKQFGISPLYLVSEGGLGKTHLAHAVVREVKRRGQGRVVYTSSEAFTSDFLSSVRGKANNGMKAFKRRYREECDLLVVEDVQFFRGKTATQLEIFHTIEHLLDSGCRVMFTADRMPRDIPEFDPRLSSRMTSGLVAEIESPDAQVRRQILRAKAAAGGVHLPQDCLDLLVETARGSVRDLEGVLIQLVACASLLKQSISLDLTKEALRKLSIPVGPEISRRTFALKDIIEVVASFFQTTLETLASRSRRRDVLVPRQLAMYLCHQYTNCSLQEIGQAFGRNHSSVKNAITITERAILERVPLRYQVEALSQKLDQLKDR